MRVCPSFGACSSGRRPTFQRRALPPPFRLGRRGMVFLLTALILVAIILTIIFAKKLPTQYEREQSVVDRIGSMDDFLKDFHVDVQRATHIAGFRSLIAIEQHIAQEGSYLADATPIFIEAFMNGTIGNASFEILENSTFSDYLDRVNAEARSIGVILNVTTRNITLSQSTPWSVDVTFLMDVNVSDSRELARWDYARSFTTSVSIIEIRDPVYSVSTFARVPNTFRRSPYNNTDFVVGGNDTTRLDDEVRMMYYREDPHAPSFLQRLEGNLSGSSKYGVASLVDLDELNRQGIFVRTYLSPVDYLYFANETTAVYCPDFGEPLPGWFKLDEVHFLDPLHNYELDDLNATLCP